MPEVFWGEELGSGARQGKVLVAIKRIPKMAKVVLLVLEGERVVRV